jgi:hypothetical protein
MTTLALMAAVEPGECIGRDEIMRLAKMDRRTFREVRQRQKDDNPFPPPMLFGSGRKARPRWAKYAFLAWLAREERRAARLARRQVLP